MAAKEQATHRQVTPDQRQLTKIQVSRVASLAKVPAEELASLNVIQVAERLKWRIDPMLFLFRKVCGRVVKKDPASGEDYPVPFATVLVEDTDCSLVSYFPQNWPWGWHFPFACQREVIGTAKTDECGNFCVWIPRFDIDWILHWRKLRFCFPIIFRRPDLGDLLPHLPPLTEGPWPPIPGPDPGPLATLTRLPETTIEALAGARVAGLAKRLSLSRATRAAGTPEMQPAPSVQTRAFDTELPPPFPADFHRAMSNQGGIVAAAKASAKEGIRASVALKVGMEPGAKQLSGFDPDRFIGPFLRCYDVALPEWQLILDVPDITFRVTQDVDGDGVEEDIYSESYFDVRWDADPLPDVTLVASSAAKESRLCETPTVPCTNKPAILFAGLMPLTNSAYFDGTSGYTVRPNRPSKDGHTPAPTDLERPPARTPFCRVLQLYGCVNVENAKYYKVLRSTDGGTNFSPITGLSWNIYTIPDGNPVTIKEVDGWYDVLANPDSYHPARMVLEWPTPQLGSSVLKVEIADASKKVLDHFATVVIQADNTAPTVVFNRLAWRFAEGEDDGDLRNLLGVPCPTIHRGATPKKIEVVFEVNVSANHFREAYIDVGNCGGGAFSLVSGTTSHWHQTTSDNAVFLHGRYQLAASALEGAYSFHCEASGRAMNPSGGDGGHLLPNDWYYDPRYIWVTPRIHVAVVNSD